MGRFGRRLVPAFLARGFSKNPDDFYGKSIQAWWGEAHPWIPLNAWAAGVAAVVTLIVLLVTKPEGNGTNFYAISAQVIPAFLIALAVERSIVDSLGTKASFARAWRDEFVDSYSWPGTDDGIVFRFEMALRKRAWTALQEKRVSEVNIPVSEVDIAKAVFLAQPHGDPMTWRLVRSRLHDEFDLPEDDPDPFEDDPGDSAFVDPSAAFEELELSVTRAEPSEAIRWLAVLTAVYQGANLDKGQVETQTMIGGIKELLRLYRADQMESHLKRVTYRAHVEYDQQRRKRTLSLRLAILLLTLSEFVALVGVVTNTPASGVLVVSTVLVAASVVNVAGGALMDLASSSSNRPSPN